MKILMTTEWNPPAVNGVVTSVMNLQEELIKLGHEVKILTLSNTPKSFERNGVYYIGSLSAGKIYPGARVAIPKRDRCIKKIIEWHPEIIHSQSEFSTFLMARYLSKKLHVPIVHTYHTVYENYTHYFSPVEKWGKSLACLFTTSTIKHTSCVIAPTEKVRNLLLGYGIQKSIKVVPTGIRLLQREESHDAFKRQALREQIGADPDTKVLIAVGRLAKEKNLEEILVYFSRLEGLKVRLLLVGDGPHRKQLELYANQLGIQDSVYFAGMVPHEEVNQFYQLGDVFVSASNSETQGLTYLEAMANGLPALCKKDPCLEDVIKDGETGWQYESFDEFQTQLIYLFQNENVAQSLSSNAKEKAYHDFSAANFASKVEEIYQETISLNKAQNGMEISGVIEYAS